MHMYTCVYVYACVCVHVQGYMYMHGWLGIYMYKWLYHLHDYEGMSTSNCFITESREARRRRLWIHGAQ